MLTQINNIGIFVVSIINKIMKNYNKQLNRAMKWCGIVKDSYTPIFGLTRELFIINKIKI